VRGADIHDLVANRNADAKRLARAGAAKRREGQVLD
jgi:hypothetical protein